MRVALLALGLAVACARGLPVDGGAGLVGTSWRLVAIDGKPVLDDSKATLRFPEKGRVAGNGSCNRFSGTVAFDGDAISVGGLGVTRMACAPPIMRQEDAYLRALEAATRVRGEDGRLVIEGREAELRFERE